MKSVKTLILLLLLSLGAQLPMQAQPCTSLFSRLVNVFDGAVRSYVDFRSEAAQLLVGTMIPGSDLDELTEDMKQIQIDAYEAAGEIVGDKATPGPVNLVVPTRKWFGALYLNRVFHVSNSGWDKVYITVKKIGGRNGVDIAVCKYDVDGNYITSKRASISKGKDTSGKQKVIEYKAMANDKYLTINLVAVGAKTDKCDYELSITGEFNNDKLAEQKVPTSAKPSQTRAGGVNTNASKGKTIKRK
ncbi:MAG: hypothetical protein AAF587_37290 [Bacteroidota bacterium]